MNIKVIFKALNNLSHTLTITKHQCLAKNSSLIIPRYFLNKNPVASCNKVQEPLRDIVPPITEYLCFDA